MMQGASRFGPSSVMTFPVEDMQQISQLCSFFRQVGLVAVVQVSGFGPNHLLTNETCAMMLATLTTGDIVETVAVASGAGLEWNGVGARMPKSSFFIGVVSGVLNCFAGREKPRTGSEIGLMAGMATRGSDKKQWLY